ncbi:MAG TPA: lipocalin family protein [Ginsengibacter sp.]|nr:lipocalin family protein [Ginsengibacter sp.]
MPKLILLAILLLVTVHFIACKKDKQNNPYCVLNETNLAGTYKYGAVTYKASPTSSAVNASALLDSCSIDDVITLGANHMYTYTDAGMKCVPSGDGTGTWSLQGNIFNASSDSGPIENFTCTSFTVANADFFNTGDTLLITFKKQ